MTILDASLFGIVAALITVKGVLLAAAVVFFVYAVAERMRRSTTLPQPVAVKRRRLDLRA